TGDLYIADSLHTRVRGVTTLMCPAPTTVTADASGHAPVPDVTPGVKPSGLSLEQDPLAGTLVGDGVHTITITVTGTPSVCTTTMTVEVVDTTPPTTTATGVLTDGAAYDFGNWTNQNVAVHLHAVDSGSGVASMTHSAAGAATIPDTSTPSDTASVN